MQEIMKHVSKFLQAFRSTATFVHRSLSRLRIRLKTFVFSYFLFQDKLRSLFGWSFIFWLVVLCYNPYYYADLYNVYTDHLRQEYVSWSFLQVGFKVFSVPLEQISLSVTALNPHVTWGMLPSLYPLGMILYFLPFGVLSNTGVVGDVQVNKLMILSFLIAAYLCIYYFTAGWKKYNFGLLTYVLAPALFYLSASFWALNGFFDVVPVLFIILSIHALKKDDYLKGILFISGAIFVHYRALMYSPLLLYFAYKLVRQKGLKTSSARKKLALSTAFVICLIDGYTFFLSFIDRKWSLPVDSPTSAVYLFNPSDQYTLGFFLVVSIGVLLYLSLRREVLAAVVLSCITCYVMLVNPWNSWHLLFFFPAVLLLNDKRSKETIFLWLLVSMYLLGGLTTPVQLASTVGRMSPHYSNVTIIISGEGSTVPLEGNYVNSYLQGQSLYVKAIPAPGWQYDYMKRYGVEWTSANPGEFWTLNGNEVIEVIFVRTVG